jgi:putative ABC transport system permease protein
MQSQASFLEAAGVALDSLRGNKLRSFLTLLGIILSTTTLISVMGVIHGMDVYIAESATTMGTEGFRVLRMAFVGNFDPKKFLELQRKNPNLTPEEYEYIQPRLTLVKESGMSAGRGGKASFGGDEITVGINGVSSNAGIMSNTQLEMGRYFTDSEDERKVAVAVIGADIRTRYFPIGDPVGKTILIDGRPFTIVGVAKPKGSVFGQSQDNFVNIPVQTYFKIYGWRAGIQYNFMAVSQEKMEQAQDEVRMQLRAYRHLKPGTDDSFSIVSSDTLVSAWNQITGTLAAVIVGIVSVFMVVGGVVIMNIMLAVVTERTREIGVRKSVGARRQDIMNQFLVESATLAGVGGLIGVGLSWIAAILVRRLTPVPMELPWSALLIGVGLSAIVGLFFGIYPARRAARLDPIVALRAET